MKPSRALSMVLFLMAAIPAFSQTVRLSRTSLAPSDPPEVLLTVSARARVTVAVKSSTGMRISLHDRMEGMIASNGENGARDGRIDLSLEAGEYKVRLEGKDASGAAVGLSATAWKELNGDKSASWPRPAEAQVLSSSLDDLQTWSCWVRGGPGRPLEVEALGRCLTGVEIWKDGQYLLETLGPREDYAVTEGKPMGWIGISREVEEGWYWLRFNGGARRVWTKEDGTTPLFVRSGFLRLPSGGRLDVKVSPFGRDWVLVGRSTAAVASRRDSGSAALAALPWSTGADRRSSSSTASIPGGRGASWARLGLDDYANGNLVLIQAEPGAEIALDCFTELSPGSREFSQTGVLSLMRARTDERDFPLTGLVFRRSRDAYARVPSVTIDEDFSLPLSSKDSIRLSTNFLSPGSRTLIIKVSEPGTYKVVEDPSSQAAGCSYRISPLDAALEGYGRGTTLSADKAAFSLTAGYHEIRVESGKSLGALDLVVFKDGLLVNPKSLLAKAPQAPRMTWNWDRETKGGGIILLSQWGSSPAGIVYHDSPLKAGMTADYELLPGESFRIGLSADAPSALLFASTGLSASIAGPILSGRTPIAKGSPRLTLSNPGTAPARASLSMEADRGPIPEPAIQPLGQGLTTLAPGKTVWRDFDRGETWTCAFSVSEPSIYVVESLGRLATAMTVRSPVRDNLFSASGNGYGRNASLRTFLRPGPYLLMLTTQGMSAGRAGVSLRKVPMEEARVLEDGSVDRRLLAADTALRATVRIGAETAAELASTSLGRAAQIRLEDAQAFPVYQGTGRLRTTLAKGEYTLYSLPESLETRRVTSLRLFPAAPEWKGDAVMRPLPFNQRQSALWSGKAATDTWIIEAPSDIIVSLSLDSAMSAVLDGPGFKGSAPASSFELKKGRHVLTVKAKEENAGYAYSLYLSTADLAPGIPQKASPSYRGGQSIEVSVPEDGLYEIWSMGQNDLAAELRRASDGALVARADDRGADWNVDIVQRLTAGRYTLSFRSLAGEGREAEFRLDAMKPRPLPEAAGSFKQKVDLDQRGMLLPFKTGKAEALYLISASGEAEVNLRLYGSGRLLASGTAEIAIPLKPSASYELYAWTAFPAKVELGAFSLTEKSVSMNQPAVLAAGAWRLTNAEGLSARVASGRALVSGGMEQICVDRGAAPFATLPGGGWAYVPAGETAIEPVRIDPGSASPFACDGTDHGFRTGDAANAILLEVSGSSRPFGALFLAPTAKAGPAPVNWDSAAALPQGLAALLPPGQWKARLREPVNPDEAEIRRLSVSASAYPVDRAAALTVGSRVVLGVQPGRALSLDAAAGRVSLIMDRGMVLSAWKDGSAVAIRASGAERRSFTLDLPACGILVANAGNAPASVRLILQAPAAVQPELTSSTPFEAAGIGRDGLSLRVNPGAGEELWIASSDRARVLFLGDDGKGLAIDGRVGTVPYDSTELPGKGRLLVESPGGFVRLWLAKRGSDPAKEGLFDKGLTKATRTLKDSLALTGKAEAFRIVMEKDGYADIWCPGPGVMTLSGKGMGTRTVMSGSREDMHLFAWLPAGEYQLLQRPPQGAPSGGTLSMATVEVTAVDAESAARPTLIAPLEYQAFSFSVAEKGKIGVGVRGSQDGLEARLYDGRQGLIASGPVMFPIVEKGRYLLVLRGDARAPVEYSIVLLGLDGSRQGPPAEVSDSYKNAPGSSRSETIPLRYPGTPASGRGGGNPYGDGAYYGNDGYSDDGGYYGDDGPYGDEGGYQGDDGYYEDDRYYGDDAPDGDYDDEGYYGDEYGY